MPHKQSGFTLVVALIMLLVMILLAVTTFRLGKSSLQLVDNQQQRIQAQNAAQETLDTVISGDLFTKNPTGVLAGAGCPLTLTVPANSMCVDVNGDGRTIEVVTMATPNCTQSRILSNNELTQEASLSTDPLTQLADLSCTRQPPPGSEGVTPSTGGSDASLCANTVWDLNATATESVSNTSAVIDEGVRIRVSTDTLASNC